MVVEGPSAAGKTTWVRTHHPDVAVWEHPPAADPVPLGVGPHWTEANVARWREAGRLEAEHGLAVCDTDPCKLHYVWCLWRIGEAAGDEWRSEARHARAAFAGGRLGLADLVLVDIPGAGELRRRKTGDPARRRGRFDLHARLGEPLREWYQAMDRVEPGRVRWALPDEGVRTGLVVPRRPRSGSELFDRLLDALPVR